MEANVSELVIDSLYIFYWKKVRIFVAIWTGNYFL